MLCLSEDGKTAYDVTEEDHQDAVKKIKELEVENAELKRLVGEWRMKFGRCNQQWSIEREECTDYKERFERALKVVDAALSARDIWRECHENGQKERDELKAENTELRNGTYLPDYERSAKQCWTERDQQNEALEKLQAEIVRLREAFNDAIDRPKGVVPKSGDEFYKPPTEKS